MAEQESKLETGEDPKADPETGEAQKGAGEQSKTLTVEELQAENEKLAKALKDANKEAANRRKKLDEYEKAEQAKAEAEKTDLQKAHERAEKAEAEKKALELKVMRRDVAAKYSLPEALIDRLKGETPEELEEDAKSLLEGLPKGEVKPKAKTNPTNPAGGSETETTAQKKERIFGPQFNPYSQQFAMEHGGGVRVPPKDEFSRGGQE
jgi:hypothetical protein